MLCRVEMPSNEQIFGRFYRYRLLHQPNGGKFRAGQLLMPIVLLAMAVLLYFSGAVLWMVLLPAAVAAAYYVYVFYIQPTRLFRQKAGAALQTEVTIFTENSFTRSVRSEEGGLPDNLSGQYDALSAAVETGKDFFLFTGPTQAYLIDKAYFTKGGPEDLRATLRAKMGARFRGRA